MGACSVAQGRTPGRENGSKLGKVGAGAGFQGRVNWGSSREGNKIVLQSSLKNKQRACRGPRASDLPFMVLTKGILKMWPPLCFPLGLHLWLTAEARRLNLGHSAAWAQREGCCFHSKEGRGGGGQGVHRKKEEADSTQGLLGASRILAIGLA